MFNPEIYRSYDIRGIVPDEFTAGEAYHIGRAYAVHTGAEKVVVARDMRPTGVDIERELVKGLSDAGVDVIRIGMATTPMFYFSVHYFKTDGGLSVTASHNPGKYNGIKMTKAQAVPIARDTGLLAIRDLVERREWEEAQGRGKVEERDVRDEYVGAVCEPGAAAGLKIVVDAGNGMAGIILKEAFDILGGQVVPLYWELDGTFPNHEANPLEEKNMRDLQAAVRKERADLGVAFDGDADRVAFTTDGGDIMPADITTALIAGEILKERPGATILYDVRLSRMTREVIEQAGGKAEITRVGHSYIKAKMRELGAEFAGEMSGHYYFVPWYAESGLMALVKLLKVVKESGQPLSELIKPYQRYAKTPEINFDVQDKAAAIQRIKEKYQDAEIFEIDGITISYPEWWANVRASGTEPLLRLNMEADTEILLESRQREIEEVIKGT